MNNKQSYIVKGSRVRVANNKFTGADRWKHASRATVARISTDQGVQVLVDGNQIAHFVSWSDVDVLEPETAGTAACPDSGEHQLGKPTTTLDIHLALLRPSRWQYRTAFDPAELANLARSIAEHGLINPILVFPHGDDESYEIIAGERRARALCALALAGSGTAEPQLGLFPQLTPHIARTASPTWWDESRDALLPLDATIRADIRHGEPADFREIVIIENLQRANPTPVEEARAFHILLDEDGYTQTALAKRLGVSQPYVSQRLGLLDLSAETRVAVEAKEIPFAMARSIATLPAGVQPAITQEVKSLMSAEGESNLTTRKVQALASQARRFLDPDAWLPPSDPILPETRNRYRLMHHYVSALDPDSPATGDVVAQLRAVRYAYGTANALGKKPTTVVGDTQLLQSIVQILDGGELAKDHWLKAAEANNWTCLTCQFPNARRPTPDSSSEILCKHWASEDADRDIVTCMHYIGLDDPVILPLTRADRDAAISYDVELTNGNTLTDLDAWSHFLNRAAALRLKNAIVKKQAASREHLPNLWAYWRAQTGDQPLSNPEEPQCHGCKFCNRFRPDHLDEDLPPCHFAKEPLKPNTWSPNSAPPMGALVARNGTVALRCAQFQVREIPSIDGLPGVVIGAKARGLFLDVLDRIYEINPHSRNYCLPATLSWLPTRDPGDGYLRAAVVRFVRAHWDELGGDTGIARLIAVALSEAKAMNGSGSEFDLMDPITGTTRTWAAVGWNYIRDGKKKVSSRNWSQSYPKDYPQPWVSREEK